MGITCNQSSPRFAKIGAILFSTARLVFVMCFMGPEIRLELTFFVCSQAAFRQPGDSALALRVGHSLPYSVNCRLAPIG